MGIAVTNPSPGKFGWILNATSADASGCEELKAAPAAGLSILVDHVTINSTAAITVTLGAGKNGAAVTTALLGPITFLAGSTLQWDFAPAGMILPAATSLTVDASGAGAVCIFARGRVE